MNDGSTIIPWWGTIPFAMLLAGIAVFPLVSRVSRWWGKLWVQAAFALSLGVPVAIWMVGRGQAHAVVASLVEYGQFITLLLSLFVVTGGVFVAGDIQATPRNNTIILGLGALCASFVGTTGAAMLAVRPLLSTNQQRKHTAHTLIFATFLVANAGGLLTPLGDPPLFLGLLRGVPFFWTLNLLLPWLFINALLLASYYAIDQTMYAREAAAAIQLDEASVTPISIKGKRQLVWMVALVLCTALLPSVHPHDWGHGQLPWWGWIPWREMAMLTVVGMSWWTGDRDIRLRDNRFTWHPIMEVAALFSGVFLTMIPALQLVAQVAPRLPVSSLSLYGSTAALSSVLDNAPTYAVFFEVAKATGGEPSIAGVRASYLEAVSLGAVFGGAITYIGNGPNFMLKSIAETHGVKMPTFGGYLIRWAIPSYLPLVVATALVFLADGWVWKVVGFAIAAVRVGFDWHAAWKVRSVR